MLAVVDRFEQQVPGRLDPPDRLDDDVDVGVADDLVRVGRVQRLGPRRDVALLRQVPDRDRDDLDAGSETLLDIGRIASEHAQHRRSDDAAAELSDPDRPAHRAP